MKSREQALWRAATERPERALEHWGAYLKQVPLDDIQGAPFRMLPAIWRNLSSEFSSFPESGRLKGIFRYALTSNARHRRACEKTIQFLQAHDIPTLVLKGIALNEILYRDLGTRPAMDFDILVPFFRAQETLDLLLADGWSFDHPDCFAPPAYRLDHAVGLNKGGMNLDLHWFALRESRAPHADDYLWEKAVSFRCGHVEARTPCLNHHLFLLLVSAAREPDNMYRYLLDVHEILKRARDQIDLEEIGRLLVSHRVSHRLNYLPLKNLGWTELLSLPQAGLVDKAWSWSSRNVYDGGGELVSGFYPLVDYLRHYLLTGRRELSFLDYMQWRLKVKNWTDFWRRTAAKIRRLLR